MTSPGQLSGAKAGLPATRPRYSPATVLLFWSVLGAGFIAAHKVATMFWVTTLAMAALIIFVERKAPAQPIVSLDNDDAVASLPAEIRRTVQSTLARLGPGDARDLLTDLVRRAQPLIAALQARATDGGTIRDVVFLLEATCALASELARVDVFLALPPAPQREQLHARCRETRLSLVDRLRAAATAIDSLHAQLLEERSEASDRVAELAAEISEEARVRGEAAREMDELLRSSPS